MIVLDLPPNQQAVIELASEQAGMSIQQYISTLIDKYAIIDKSAEQKRNSMIERIKVMPIPTSYDPQQAVNIQRDLRDEWT